MKRKRLSKARLDDWVRWSLAHLEDRRVDPFLQGWRCAFALIMAVEGIPQDVRKEICRGNAYAESILWQKTRKMKY